MKPCLKLQMLEDFANSLPISAGHELNCGLYRLLKVCASTDNQVLVLRWDAPHHQQLMRFLSNSLRTETYQWVRGHIRFDGVPPAALNPNVSE